MTGPHTFARDARGASAAEFALVLPLTLLLLFGLIDTGRYIWGLNQIEKAAQMGARFAVVTDPVAGGVSTTDYVGDTSCGAALKSGDAICAAARSAVVCSNTACTPSWGTFSSTAYTHILSRMQVFAPYIGTSNMTVTYTGVGLGFAGQERAGLGADISPLVTVTIQNMQFQPVMGSLFDWSLPYPTIQRSLTFEDGQGAQAS